MFLCIFPRKILIPYCGPTLPPGTMVQTNFNLHYLRLIAKAHIKRTFHVSYKGWHTLQQFGKEIGSQENQITSHPYPGLKDHEQNELPQSRTNIGIRTN